MLIDQPRVPFREILLHGWWPSLLKVCYYRLIRKYKIGRNVSIGFGSVICGDRVEIGDHSTIGFLTIVRGRSIRLGSYVQIGATTFLDTPNLEIGDGTKINEQVFVGGLQFPDSRFVLGRNCQIMQMSFINPARSIVVGDDTGIGGHCLIFGHTSWLSQFEGYPVDFAPIEIGNSVSLAWGVFVMQGTRIGDGSVIGANSVVHGTIPPRSLALGFPARVISREPEFPKPVSSEDKVRIFRQIVDTMTEYFSGSHLSCERDGELLVIQESFRRSWRKARPAWRLLIVEDDPREAFTENAGETIHAMLSLAEIPQELRERLAARKIVWIDIARKEQASYSNDLGDEVGLFLKRYGVRTIRC